MPTTAPTLAYEVVDVFTDRAYAGNPLAVVLDAVWLLCQRLGRPMVERGTGKIINVASLLSFSGGITVPAYTASKHAVAGLTKALANEWARYGVQVNAIAPGYFPTRLTKGVVAEREAEIIRGTPLGRLGRPGELKGVVAFLASAAAGYITGQVIAIDGGVTAT